LEKYGSGNEVQSKNYTGAAAQSEATWTGYEFLAWNNTDQYQEMVEGKLGSWTSQLPAQAFARY
jgi:hypothetical protein